MKMEVQTDGIQNDADGIGSKEDVVKYENHKKLMDQHKAGQKKLAEANAKLEEFEKLKADLAAKEAQFTEKKLADEGNWKALLETREQKLKELEARLSEESSKAKHYEKSLLDAAKIQAFTSKIGGSLKKSEYYNFIDTDKIAIDPDTKNIDDASLTSYANEFTSSYKELINFSDKKLPSDAAQKTKGLSYEVWSKLPYKEKMKHNFKDIK